MTFEVHCFSFVVTCFDCVADCAVDVFVITERVLFKGSLVLELPLVRADDVPRVCCVVEVLCVPAYVSREVLPSYVESEREVFRRVP